MVHQLSATSNQKPASSIQHPAQAQSIWKGMNEKSKTELVHN
jgi:hypothetical protein